MKKSCVFLLCALSATVFLAACDLQPRIVALPDSVGEFIEERYPALLADPVAQAEIYNSAATDYGVYASPELYGSVATDDYILYSDINDYMLPAQDASVADVPEYRPVGEADAVDTVDAGAGDSGVELIIDTPDLPVAPAAPAAPVAPAATSASAASVAPAAPVASDTPADVLVVPAGPAEYGVQPVTSLGAGDSGAPWGATNDVLNIPMYGRDDDTRQIKVARGDTLYSVAKRYNTTVPDLAAMNSLAAPYALREGQMLRVPGTADVVVSAASAASAAPKASAAPAASKTPSTPSTPAATAAPAAPAAQKANPPATKPATPAAPKAPVAPAAPTPARVQLQTVTVGAGDTLYSISRAYSVPVNDLAVMNDLSAPFRLTVGQKLKVPNLQAAAQKATSQKSPVAPTKSAGTAPKTTTGTGGATQKTASQKTAAQKNTAQKTATKNAPAPAAPKPKISSDPKKKLPAIAARSSSKFSWPIRGKILSGFGSKPNGLVNDGINISATRGSTVKAAENGVVAYAGNEVKGMGNLVIIQHSEGWMTVYAHLDTMAVRRGAKVNVGQKIGTVGTSGKVDKPQLHFEIRKGTKAYNPSQYLKK